ncbi:hypothetical protein QQP08_018324, partial [Theobroma cacao]
AIRSYWKNGPVPLSHDRERGFLPVRSQHRNIAPPPLKAFGKV